MGQITVLLSFDVVPTNKKKTTFCVGEETGRKRNLTCIHGIGFGFSVFTHTDKREMPAGIPFGHPQKHLKIGMRLPNIVPGFTRIKDWEIF